MADLSNYQDKLLQDDPSQQQTQASSVTPTAGTSGVISGGGTSGVSTAGVGAGGTGGWTNIQAYLGANKGDNGSAKALSDKASSQYDAEANALNTQAGAAKSQAESQANKVSDAQNNSKEWVSQASKAYNYDGQQNDDYLGQTQKLKSALYDQYSGPSNFAYETSADFQRTGSALKDNNAFNNYMNDIYKQKAGGTLTSGQGALQTQLDVNNQNLADARQNLLTKYSGFGDQVNSTVKDTDAAIQTAKQNYGNNQSNLRSYLTNMGNDFETAQAKAEADARAAYNTDYSTGKSGKQAAGLNEYEEFNTGGPGIGINSYIAKENRQNLMNSGLFSDDLTWKQLQQEADRGGLRDFDSYGSGAASYRDRMNGVNNQILNERNTNKSALEDFYGQQDAKYANTADSEKRSWNTIMDILNNSARKNQGFQVRS